MIVNNINLIATYGVIITSKDIQNSEVINFNDWIDNAIDPVRLKEEKFKFSNITVSLLVEGANEDEILTKISNILVNCKSGVLKFSDIDYYYNISLKDSTNKKICEIAYELTFSFQSTYKYKDEVIETINRLTTKVITSNGNLETLAIVEITPSITIIDLVLNINSEAITIKTLTAGKKIIIDGEKGSVTELGINKFKDVDLWKFPRLSPGENTITTSRSTCDISIKYKPRFI